MRIQDNTYTFRKLFYNFFIFVYDSFIRFLFKIVNFVIRKVRGFRPIIQISNFSRSNKGK